MLRQSRSLRRLVGFKQGKGGMWKSCITVHRDIQVENAEKYLKTSEEEQLKIVIFQQNKRNKLICIVGDGTIFHVKETNLDYALIVLVCCYYVFDLAYLRKYSQILGLIQHQVLED